LESPDAKHDPYAAFRVSNYRWFAAGHVMNVLGGQMAAVAVGWELYQRTNSATALGLVGFVQFFPILFLGIPAGHVADVFDRRKIVMLSQIAAMLSAFSLGIASLFSQHIPLVLPLRLLNDACIWLARSLHEQGAIFNDGYVPLMYVLLLINGVVRAFYQPARSSLLPQIVPGNVFTNAVTWTTSLFETCAMIGPTVGGGIIAALMWKDQTKLWAYPAIYLINSLGQFGQVLSLSFIKVVNPPREKEPITLKSLSAGITHVWQTKLLLATITLDLLAVILGGATALLPIFAKDILHMGPTGLGWLRAGPSFGAVAMAMIIAHRPPMKHAGRNLLLSVIGFGFATIIFGLSKNFWLSFVMLVLIGGLDNISVLVRHTLAQTLTPDHLRGRVSAVTNIFIYCSDQLGSFESGILAARLGAVASTVIGGVGAIIVTTASAFIWPQLRELKSLSDTEHTSK